MSRALLDGDAAGTDREDGVLRVVLDGPALTAFVTAGRTPGDDDRSALAELGLLPGPDGATRDADRLREEVGPEALVLRLRSLDEHGLRRAWVRSGLDRALLLVERETLGDGEPDDDRPRGEVTACVLARTDLPLALAWWAGVRPFGIVAGDVDVVHDGAAVARRLRSSSEPVPPDASVALRRLWQAPWTRWSIASDDGAIDVVHVRAEGVGQVALRPHADGAVALAARPDGLVWGDLQRVPVQVAQAHGVPDPDASDW